MTYEADILSEIRGQLAQQQSRGFEDITGRSSGPARPDLVLKSPSGEVVVLEFKHYAPNQDLHFAALAQVASYSRMLSEQYSAPARALLVTNGRVQPRLEETARQLGVAIIELDETNKSSSVANLLQNLSD
ncbi:hypothetical protein [Blastococcus sp. SYSU DS0539]